MRSFWILALMVPATCLLGAPKKSADAKLSPVPEDIPKNMIAKGHCGMKVERNTTKVAKKVALLQRNPGAGSSKSGIEADIEAMTQHKDGYFYVGCVGDSMMMSADKHGGQ